MWLCYCAFNERTNGGGAPALEKRALAATEPRSHKAFLELANYKRLHNYAVSFFFVNIFSCILNVSEAIFHHQLKYT